MKLLSSFVTLFLLSLGIAFGQCDAQFSFSTSGSGLTVAFQDSSVLPPVGNTVYEWSFGDGTISQNPNPVHTYASPGAYQVCLYVENLTTPGNTCVDTVCSVITLLGSSGCQADFTYAADTAIFFQLNFYGGTSTGGNLTYSWDFGDGNSGTGQNPIHAYNMPGTFQVCLTITDNTTGCSDTFCDTVVVTQGGVSCSASFYQTSSGSGNFAFINQSSSANPLTYSWDFGDGSTSTQENPTHNFTTAGIYQVCLTISDGNQCLDTHCAMVAVTFGANCLASFYAIQDTSNTNTWWFDGSVSQPASLNSTQLTWDFGDGSPLAQGFTPTHTYATPALYIVSLTVGDSSIGCFDTYYDTVDASGSNTLCQASFGTQINGLVASYTNTSSASPVGAVYAWDFGNGSTSSVYSPTHTYASPGTYVTCLTVSVPGTSCLDTYCATVVIPGIPNGAILSGTVFPYDSSAMIYNGLAYLIQHDSSTNSLNLIDTTNIQQSFYSFNNVAPGTYLVKAALTPASPLYADNLPTYVGNELFWDDALSLVVTVSNVWAPTLLLTQGVNPGGPGFIGGGINSGANKQGDPLEGLDVILLDANDNPIAFTTSDASGAYSFPSLAYGTYKLYLEIPGRYGDPVWITLDENNPSMELIDFEVDDDSWAATTTAIDVDLLGQSFQLFPNPTQDQLNVEIQLNESAEVQLSVLNLIGQELQREQHLSSLGTQRYELQVGALPAGTYLLRLQAGELQLSRRFVIAK